MLAKQLKMKQRKQQQKGGFLGILVGTLAANLLGNMLAGKEVTQAGKGTTRDGQYF